MSIIRKLKTALTQLVHATRRPIIAMLQEIPEAQMLSGKRVALSVGAGTIGKLVIHGCVRCGADIVTLGSGAELIGISGVILCAYDSDDSVDLLGPKNEQNAGTSDVDARDIYFSCREAIREISKNPSGGSIVFLYIRRETHIRDQKGVITEAVLSGLTQGLAKELANECIRVNQIGVIVANDDEGVYTAQSDTDDQFEGAVSMALLLLSDACVSVTGQQIYFKVSTTRGKNRR